MDREDLESALDKVIRLSKDFRAEPTYDKALQLDIDICLIRLMVGEQNFQTLHYFCMMHEEASRFIEKTLKEREKKNEQH